MKNHLPLCRILFVLFGATIFWTSCQKELSNKPVFEQPEAQARLVFGVIPDDPAKAALVPLILSSEYISMNFDDLSAIESMLRGKGDNIAPVVTITSPSAGATVSGVINVTVNASDNVGVKKVSLSVDGIIVSTSVSSPFTNSWNTGTVANGTHILKVTASDARGNSSENSIQVSVNNVTTGDIISPTVSILSPADQASVTGIVTISISASDNVAVTSVSISINNSMVSTSYSYLWNTANYAAGYHTISATARDAAGNQSSKSITVSINTTVVPPPPPGSGVQLVMPPVGNQGSEGACVAFAIGYAARSAEQYYQTNSASYNNSTNVFSPEFLYNQIKFSLDCTSGTSMQTALDFIKINGISTFQSMPYSSTNGCSLLPTSAQLAEALNFKIGGYSKIITTDKAAIKAMISQNHPVIITIIADNSFVNASTGFIWKTYSGSGTLPHCIVICGYDDTKNAYKVMNSWGTGWGDAGFSWIDYDFLPTKAGVYSYVIN